jgi:hypothetical protein
MSQIIIVPFFFHWNRAHIIYNYLSTLLNRDNILHISGGFPRTKKKKKKNIAPPSAWPPNFQIFFQK